MIPASRVYLWTLPLIASGCVLVAALDLKSVQRPSPFAYFAIGCSIGTLFGHTTIAALWTALGPAVFYRRLLSSVIWLMLLLSAMVIGFRFGAHSSQVLLFMGTSLAMQWILVQVPLWLLAFAYGLRLRFPVGEQSDAGRPQFGLSQLMLFTLGVAVVLGVSRWFVASGVLAFRDNELPVFLFLAVAAVLISLPLTLAALMPRLAWLGVLLILALAGMATTWELPLLKIFSDRGGPDIMHLVWINLFTSAWVLAFVVAARVSGYRLVLSHGPTGDVASRKSTSS